MLACLGSPPATDVVVAGEADVTLAVVTWALVTGSTIVTFSVISAVPFDSLAREVATGVVAVAILVVERSDFTSVVVTKAVVTGGASALAVSVATLASVETKDVFGTAVVVSTTLSALDSVVVVRDVLCGVTVISLLLVVISDVTDVSVEAEVVIGADTASAAAVFPSDFKPVVAMRVAIYGSVVVTTSAVVISLVTSWSLETELTTKDVAV